MVGGVIKRRITFSRVKFLKQILFTLLILQSILAFAQEQSTVADSVERELNALDKSDPEYLQKKAGIMGTLLQTVKFSDPEKALRLCDELGGVFMQIEDSVRAYEAMYRYKAGIYELRGEYDKMLMNLEAYAEALNEIGKSDGYVYIDIGNVYFSFAMYDLARENYNYAEKIFLKENSIQGLCTIYNNIAQINMAGQKNDSALAWLRKSYDLRKNQLKDNILAHESMYLMSKVFRDKMQYDSSVIYLRVVIADFNSPELQKHTDHIALHQEFAGAYTAMGVTFTMKQEWDSAVYYFQEGEKVYLRYGYKNRLPALYNQWTRMYLAKNDAANALVMIKNVEANSSKQNPNEAMQLYDLYADYYELMGNREESYRNRITYYRINDSLQASGYQEQMIIAASRVMQLQNQARIEGQKAELAQKDIEAKKSEQERIIFIIVLSALALLFIVAALSVYQLRKKTRIIQKYNAELHLANATKEQLLSVVSHDLRSPFNTLIGISDLMVRNMKNKDYAGVTGNAELIRESSRKAYVLLDNLMQWVSLQKETIRVRRENVSLNELTDEILLLFRGQALANSSTVVKDIRVTDALTDKNLLQVILRNLVSNALKNIPVAGKVKIIMEAVGNDLRVIIEDNGKGLSNEDLNNLFTEKERTSIARKGGGLGLLLVDQFVRQLNGTISAENVSTGGARFTILLRGAIQNATQISTQTVGEDSHHAITAKELKALIPIMQKLRSFEIYDTTEIREVINAMPADQSEGVEWWKNKILEAVYRSDEIGFRSLINATSHEDIRQ